MLTLGLSKQTVFLLHVAVDASLIAQIDGRTWCNLDSHMYKAFHLYEYEYEPRKIGKKLRFTFARVLVIRLYLD